MIQEAYVSFEVAKLLKEKGFAEISNTIGTYNSDGVFYLYKHEKGYNHNHLSSWYSAPTHQMAMAWLREKYYIHIDITIEGNGSYIDYKYVIRDFSIIFPTRNYDSIDTKDGGRAKTYEEAVEAALKFVLENYL